MKFVSFALIIFVMTFCGLQEKLKQIGGGTTPNTAGSNSSSTSSSSTAAEKAKLTPAQQSIADSGTKTKWDEQGVSWRLPAGWKKMDVKKEQFN